MRASRRRSLLLKRKDSRLEEAISGLIEYSI
jgi:hypothetical protein